MRWLLLVVAVHNEVAVELLVAVVDEEYPLPDRGAPLCALSRPEWDPAAPFPEA